MRGRQHPLGADQRATAKVLVERIDQRHLPTPFGRVRVFATDHPRRPRPGRSFDAAHVFAVRRRLGRYRVGRGQRGHRRIHRIVDCEKQKFIKYVSNFFIRFVAKLLLVKNVT